MAPTAWIAVTMQMDKGSIAHPHKLRPHSDVAQYQIKKVQPGALSEVSTCTGQQIERVLGENRRLCREVLLRSG
eukprot:CAMPEP_0184988386 /NCGR_PEP_ID=MMETSP1098-20130426/24306_1 /TAXON_ID=89044 /ORGANISM="Spumella elongata, Strain CCAP 955/1" /LENGTH=73 /DNA_ID=CAMNT_0027513123 /DNA_START=37 /DNA_END=256 /DNA_ORIENTATION=+